MSLNSDGFRGAVLFKAGQYSINGTITISASGVVLLGEGNSESGTCFIATKPEQHTLISFSGNLGTSLVTSSTRTIVDSYVPIGVKEVSVYIW